MKRALPAFAFLALALLPAAPALAEDARPAPSYANPSAVIAAELAFARAAQERGQWTAFRETAAADAVMFVPAMVLAQAWLKDRADPPQAVRWQPHEVWSSCDGSLVVSHGAWQKPGQAGWFTTIWQRQEDGGYKWVLDHGDSVAEPASAPEFTPAHVAECPPRRDQAADAPPPPGGPRHHKRKRKPVPPPFDPAHRAGKSQDGTIAWEVTAEPDGAHNLSITWRRAGHDEQLLIEQVSAR